MSKFVDKLKRKKFRYEKMREPVSLDPDPVAQEAKLGLVVASPLLVFMIAWLYLNANFLITPEESMMLMGVGFVMWIVIIYGVYAHYIKEGNSHVLFDREFGFTQRLRPRHECYCKPTDIRLLIDPEKDRIENFAKLKETINNIPFEPKFKDKLISQLKELSTDGFKKYVYYFRHKHARQGWNKREHTVLTFSSHICFYDKPYEQQNVFGVGQENWFGPVVFRHIHCESDNVDVLDWVRDPFTSEPMPLCNWLHGSRRYGSKMVKSQDEFKLVEAQAYMIAKLHGLTETLRKEVQNVTQMKDANFAGHKNIVDLAHDGSKADIEYFNIAMKEVPRGWLRSTFGKVIVSIVTISAIVLVVALVLNWIGVIDLSGLFGG